MGEQNSSPGTVVKSLGRDLVNGLTLIYQMHAIICGAENTT